MVDQTAAAVTFGKFVTQLDREAHIHILTDSDADGLPAAALLLRGLRIAGYTHVTAQVRQKAESAWSSTVRQRLREAEPDALLIVDLGSRVEEVLPGVPTLLIDHHVPSGVPAGATLISGYRVLGEGDDAKTIPTSGLLAWFSIQCLITPSNRAAIEALLWLAAISLLSDLGDQAPFAELQVAKKQFGAGALREVTTLLNAPRRSVRGDATGALRLLLLADTPKQILQSEDREIVLLREVLRAAKQEVAEALAAARTLPPRFSKAVRSELGADLVAIRMHTGCQVHPLIAQQWRTRFPRSAVFGVNTGFRSGWVHFSGRSPRSVNLIQFLAAHRPQGADDSYGNGHDQAAGGALRIPIWNRFAAELGFGPEMQVDETGASEEGTT